MNNIIKLFTVCLISCLFLSACSNINPLAPPSFENHMMENEGDQSKYVEDINEMIESNETLTGEKASDYSDQIRNKTDEIYYKALDGFKNNSRNKEEGETWVQSLLIGFYSTYNSIRLVSPVIFIVSIVFGVIGMLFSRYNKGAKRFFLVAFVIAIPILLIIIVFGIGILNSIFIYNN